MKILVTRTDRLGDLVLSLPVWAGLKAACRDWEIHVMVAPGAVPLVENDPHLERIWTWHDEMTTDETAALVAELVAAGFEAVVMLQYRRQLATMLRSAGIKLRYGPWSKWTSWFHLNRGVRQNRSAGEQHEMDFNIQLGRRVVADLGDRDENDIVWPAPRLVLTPDQELGTRDFQVEYAPGSSQSIFIHPGSGGSALNWEPARFAAVANALAEAANCRIFVTGAGADAQVLEQVTPTLVPAVTVLQDRFDLRQFLAVLAAGHLFIGPSTGPLHLAAALGVPTLGLFPPVRTMNPDRWGPRGYATAAPMNIMPDLTCPARRLCSQERCRFYNCLQEISVETVVSAARKILSQG